MPVSRSASAQSSVPSACHRLDRDFLTKRFEDQKRRIFVAETHALRLESAEQIQRAWLRYPR